MTFLWPQLLWLLAALPLLVAAYLLLQRRRKWLAVRYASLTMVRDAIGGRARFRRHVPPLLFLLSIAAMLLAIARPAAVVSLPTQHETIILAMDVSGSMRATDVEPNRLTAAESAAKAFIADQPVSTRVGIVSFAGTAAVVQPPTNIRDDLYAAIDRFQLQRGTDLAGAIVISLATIFPDAGIDMTMLSGQREFRRDSRVSGERPSKAPDKPEFKPVQPGSYTSAAIVLITDGQRTSGPDSMAAAKLAADRGVRVYTVGIGTPQGTTLSFEGWSMHVKLDEETLKQIANVTHGQYFQAASSSDLRDIYKNLTSRFALEKKQTEVSALFAAVAALLALAAAALSMLWFNRIL